MSSRQGSRQGASAWQALLLYAAVAAAHVGTIALARAISRTTTVGVPLWAAAGVTVSVLLLSPRQRWPGVLLATFAANLVSNLVIDIVVPTAVGGALANTVEALLGALVVLHVLGAVPRLDHRRDLVVFLTGAVGVGPLVGALLGAAGIQLSPGHPPYLDVVWRWFIGDALGVLIVGSLILVWCAPTARWETSSRRGIAAVAAAALIGLTVVAFWGSSPVLAYLALPPLVLASIRFGARGATLGGLAVAVIADWATIRGRGLFVELSGKGEFEALWQLQLFLAVLLVTALVLAVQVTELGEAQTALRASEEKQRLGSMLESSPDPTLVVRGDSTVLYCNEQFLALSRRTREELIGRPFIHLIRPERRQRVLEVLAFVLEQPAGSRSTFEMAGLGEVLDRALETALSPLDTLDGRVLVSTVRDVTQRNAAEAALRAARDTAEAATTAKTRFLATMSHEIRTPLSAVTSLIELLGHSELDAQQQSLLHTMRESSDALLRIVDDTLDFSKIEAGKLDLESVPMAVDEEMRSIAALLQPAAAAKGLRLTCTTEPPEPPAVLGDPLRIHQILLNLVSNAVKFTTEGGVDVTAAVPAPDTTGRVDVVFTVRDTGIGMDADRQTALFRPFTQAEHSTTRLYGGTGLGLSIVSHLIDLMHGTVDVTSAPGAGSTFVVRLPLPLAPAGAVARSRTGSPAGAPTPDDARLAGHVVLVVEDNEVNRDVLQRQLAVLGCAADAAGDGREALDRLARGGISLVLTDCHMPVMDGFDLTHTVRGEERGSTAGGPRLPIVAVTANAMYGEGDRCLAAGMDAFLIKPVDIANLARVLADFLPAAPVRPPAVVDLNVLRGFIGDDEDELASVLRTFTTTVQASAEEVGAGSAAGDRTRTRHAAHRLVGAAGSVGAARMGSLARAVELAASSAEQPALDAAVAWLLDEIRAVAAAVSLPGTHRG